MHYPSTQFWHTLTLALTLPFFSPSSLASLASLASFQNSTPKVLTSPLLPLLPLFNSTLCASPHTIYLTCCFVLNFPSDPFDLSLPSIHHPRLLIQLFAPVRSTSLLSLFHFPRSALSPLPPSYIQVTPFQSKPTTTFPRGCQRRTSVLIRHH